MPAVRVPPNLCCLMLLSIVDGRPTTRTSCSLSLPCLPLGSFPRRRRHLSYRRAAPLLSCGRDLWRLDVFRESCRRQLEPTRRLLLLPTSHTGKTMLCLLQRACTTQINNALHHQRSPLYLVAAPEIFCPGRIQMKSFDFTFSFVIFHAPFCRAVCIDRQQTYRHWPALRQAQSLFPSKINEIAQLWAATKSHTFRQQVDHTAANRKLTSKPAIIFT